MDVTKSHDPLAPEGTDLSAEPADEAQADPQPAVTDPVDHGDAPDVSADAVESEAPDAPDPEAEEPIDFNIGRTLAALPDVHDDEPELSSELDPTAPAESDGPTEPAEEHDEPEPEITDERGIDATDDDEDAEPETPSTSEEAH